MLREAGDLTSHLHVFNQGTCRGNVLKRATGPICGASQLEKIVCRLSNSEQTVSGPHEGVLPIPWDIGHPPSRVFKAFKGS